MILFICLAKKFPPQERWRILETGICYLDFFSIHSTKTPGEGNATSRYSYSKHQQHKEAPPKRIRLYQTTQLNS